MTKNQSFIETSEKIYQEVIISSGLTQGEISLGFSYENIDGKLINLSDLKGSYVYIDVWAARCESFAKQVPYLMTLEKRYHDKNIVFVSNSVDKEKVKSSWRQIVQYKQLVGLQLFADNFFYSEFMSAYNAFHLNRSRR